jgi:transmembrane sensor
MPSNDHSPWDGDGSTEAIAQEAAEWFVLRDAGFTVRQQEEFERWLQADERHAEVYAELDETWSRLGELRAVVPDAPVAAAARAQPHGKLIWLAGALAAAAAVVVAYVSWWPSPAPAAAPFSVVASTDVGRMRRISLSDGSVVRLNTDSAVAVQFSATERRVRLVRGEADFQVTKNPAWPFVVSAGRVAVRAVGTAFDVRMRPEAVEVLVTEGKVSVDDDAKGKSLLASPFAGGTPLLVAGQRAFIALGTAAVATTVTPAEIDQALAWQKRRLEFVATPLADIVAEFNRYNRHKLVITDPRLATRRFGGTFSVGDHAELVRLLEADFGVVADRGENETKLRLAP